MVSYFVLAAVAAISVVAGGAGGFFWGRKVEAKAQAELKSFAQRASTFAGSVKQAGSDLRKGL